jgi:hypothetical protein
MTQKKKPAPKKIESTIAIHGQAKNGTNLVGIGNLRVVIIEDGDLWFAQGLEIDYAAQGETIEDVKHKFESGLACTIHEHLKTYGNIEDILRIAPSEVWEKMFSAAAKGKHFSFSQVSFHQNVQKVLKPIFGGIVYLKQKAA